MKSECLTYIHIFVRSVFAILSTLVMYQAFKMNMYLSSLGWLCIGAQFYLDGKTIKKIFRVERWVIIVALFSYLLVVVDK